MVALIGHRLMSSGTAERTWATTTSARSAFTTVQNLPEDSQLESIATGDNQIHRVAGATEVTSQLEFFTETWEPTYSSQ